MWTCRSADKAAAVAPPGAPARTHLTEGLMIPFIDLRTQYARIQEEVETAVINVMRSGQYILGDQVLRLEEELARYCGVGHAVTCASGMDALVIGLMAKGIGSGDAVFTTPFTFMASAEAIAIVGATPIFVDIRQDSFNIDPRALGRAISALAEGDPTIHPLPRLDRDKLVALRPRGILAVDLFGLPAEYAAIQALAAEHGLTLIEDAAQSFGATLNNQRAGALAEIGCTSFFPAKPLGCYGDGGALFTDDAELADVFKSIRVHGQGAERYQHVRLGLTARLDAIQAAVLSVKLRIFDEELAERQRVAETYTSLIEASGLPLIVPQVPAGRTSAWAQYSVLAEDSAARAAFQDRLNAAGVPTGVYYPKGLPLQDAFDYLGYQAGDFPVLEACSEGVFSLPMHPYLQTDQISHIVMAMKG